MSSKLETSMAYLPLFVPATRPERFNRAAISGASAIVIDLEDSVPALEKKEARQLLKKGFSDALAAKIDVFIRINAVHTEWYEDDLLAVSKLPIRGVMLAKCQSPGEIIALRRSLPTLAQVIALIESPRGLALSRSIATVAERLAFGSLDYSILIRSSHTPRALAAARAELVFAAALSGRMGPIDGVTTNLADVKRVFLDSRHGAAMGMGGKLLIHPSQVAPARKGYCPSTTDIDRARKILEVADAGAVAVDGMMVDAPVVDWAKRILATAASLMEASE